MVARRARRKPSWRRARLDGDDGDVPGLPRTKTHDIAGPGKSSLAAVRKEPTDMVIPYGYVTLAYLVQPKEGPQQIYAGL